MKPQVLVSIGTYGVPIALAALLLALNTGSTGEAFQFNSAKWAGLFWLSCACIAGYVAMLAACFVWSRENRRQQFWLPLIASGVIAVVGLAVLEIGVRFVTQPHPFGRQLGALVLKPYEWDSAKAYNQELYENSQDPAAYYVGHPKLGWTVGQSRTSKDGLYASSAEGLRSETAGESLIATQSASRIALFGNSFVFSEEVPFEDSLVFHLEKQLGDDYQFLNFGVPGYGVDQAYLRFREEADEWKPAVAVLGIIADDLIRDVNVYAFLKPSWGIPFSKPKFRINGDGLELLNMPNITPETMFAAAAISELPHLDQDITYFDFDWRHGALHRSVLYRTLISLFPKFQPDNPHTSDDAVTDIGARLSRRFVDLAAERGAIPVVLYLPSKIDFRRQNLAVKTGTIEKARALGVEILDLTDCIRDGMDEVTLFVTGGVHYSGEGNRRFAQCLTGVLPAGNAARAP